MQVPKRLRSVVGRAQSSNVAVRRALPALRSAAHLVRRLSACAPQPTPASSVGPRFDAVVFVIPARFGGRRRNSGVKNREDRLVVLNDTAKAVIESCRGEHPERVFVYRGKPVKFMNNSAWQKARKQVGLPQVRVHDLKHTFGRRLRAVGVPLETRKVLLGHKSGDITTHYSAPEIAELLEAANRVAETRVRTLLRVIA